MNVFHTEFSKFPHWGLDYTYKQSFHFEGNFLFEGNFDKMKTAGKFVAHAPDFH
jgi:hypothetical protein